MIPFVKVLGLTILAVRLPMAILGCIAIFVMYKLLRLIGDKKLALIGTIFLVICPWHIMKSRWGLESNLFPELMLFSIYFLELFLRKGKNYGLYLSFAFLGISAYSYGTSYFFLPIFVILILIYLIATKKAKISQVLIAVAIAGIVALPIMLYVIINTLHLKQINLPFMTIPRMLQNRYEEVSNIFGSDFLKTSITNFKNSIKILVTGEDGLPWNSIKFFGIVYVISFPFTIIGIVESIKNKKTISINLWFLVSILLLFVVEANINRINIIMLPIVYYTLFGIYTLLEKTGGKIVPIGIGVMYLVLFVSFINSYFTRDFSFATGWEDVVNYTEQIDVSNVYVEYITPEPYIYYLFYSKGDPNEFVETVKYFNPDGIFNNIAGYGKYSFCNSSLDDSYVTKDTAVVKPKEEVTRIDRNRCKVTEFERFAVLESK